MKGFGALLYNIKAQRGEEAQERLKGRYIVNLPLYRSKQNKSKVVKNYFSSQLKIRKKQ